MVLSFASRGFSPGTPVFPSPQKPAFPNSNSTRNQVDEEPLCVCATCKSLFIFVIYLILPHFMPGNIHSKLSLVSMLKDHVTLLNLLNLHGVSYPLNFFGVYCLTIVKIGDTTNILYKSRFHADRSHDRF